MKLSKMKVVFITKRGWLILLGMCLFVLGNIVLLYRFVSKHSATLALDPRLTQLSDKYLESMADGKLKDIGEVVKTLREKPSKSASTIKGESVEKPEEEEKTSKKPKTVLVRVARPVVIYRKKRPLVPASAKNVTTAVLVVACNRPEALIRCLDLLLRYRPSAAQFPIVVSQDCGHKETAEVIAAYGSQVKHIQQPDLSDVEGVPSNMKSMMGYYKISRHYKWAFGQMFDVMGFDTVTVVEDDLDIAPDFYEYFTATKSVLEKDPWLWCISAWNDNGKEGMVQRNDVLYRTDFFPGLGWMLRKDIWDELKPKWPLGFWDDWMREGAQRKNRACIRPEIPRTKTFGRVGVSRGQFYDQHLRFIKLNEKFHPFTKTDLSYLLKDSYDRNFVARVHTLPLVTVDQLVSKNVFAEEVQIHYSSELDFKNVGKRLGVMTDFKAGIPRMAYQGIVTVVFKGKTVHLVPGD